ncbi:MAG TPA: M3 family oligoendopeptidase [Anaerolineales bacterium]|jgi:oligoendopeptidase F
MENKFPLDTKALMQWTWTDIEPFYQELQRPELTLGNVSTWLKDWSDLISHVDELYTRLFIATTQYTADADVEKRFNTFIESIQPKARTADQMLKEKLLASQLDPPGFELPLRKMRTEAGLFREANLPLLTEEQKLNSEYNRIIGGQTFLWEGQERTTRQMFPLLQEKDRTTREKAWGVLTEGRLKDRAALNELWEKLMRVRMQIAANNGLPDYRAYIWEQKFRFDYTPEDCKAFHRAIEEVVVPAASRMYARRKKLLGVGSVRPWDVNVDPFGDKPLKPFQRTEELQNKVKTILERVDPEFGHFFETMVNEGLLDMESRKNKAPGAYSLGYAVKRQPFIFMSSAGTHDDVVTLLHEGGHAVHEFERGKLEYFQHRSENYLPAEFAEVASMGMELLATPYLTREQGGFYDEAEAARARIDHLDGIIGFWPYMALVDTFQHWIYENQELACDGATCENKWGELWDRFMPGIDYAGLEDAKKTYWQRQMHIFTFPFYYIEYGMAQLGATQVWANSLEDQRAAVQAYKNALALGSTVGLPKLFGTAGAKFSFDPATLKRSVDLIEKTIHELEMKL